jgi:uncharacterized protein (TIGR03546 family)
MYEIVSKGGLSMFWFNLLAKLISLLHSGENPRQMAGGFALGLIIGLTPFFSLHNFLIFSLIYLINVDIAAAMFGMFIFGLFAYLLDPFFHSLGYFLLVKVEFLKPVWTYLYNVPIAPLTKFYNTVVLGSLVTSLILFWPVFWGFQKLVIYYQQHLAEKVNRLKVIQIIKGNNWVQWYNRIKWRA